ncbi:hypothetical protein TRVL_02637 [Trypanosoma vivax]|nr:hypothetical protein TRVL_02637 [Trypanosoma vivax]
MTVFSSIYSAITDTLGASASPPALQKCPSMNCVAFQTARLHCALIVCPMASFPAVKSSAVSFSTPENVQNISALPIRSGCSPCPLSVLVKPPLSNLAHNKPFKAA